MKVTPEQFLDALGQSNISLEKKKEILRELKDYSEEEIEYIYKLLDENVKEQKRIIALFRRQNKMINLDFDVKLKRELKKLSKNELKDMIKEEYLEDKKRKKRDEIHGIG